MSSCLKYKSHSFPAGRDFALASNNKKRPKRGPPPNNALDHDVLSAIFSLLDCCQDLVSCSLVCKTWRTAITKCRCFKALDHKQRQMGLVRGLCLEEMAGVTHRLALLQSRRINVDQWKGHSANIDQCRKKDGLLLTGSSRKKFMRLWSLEESRKCVYKFQGEYRVPVGYGPLVDFDFDESKIVGLVGSKNSQICIWRRSGMTRILNPFKCKGTFPKGLCMSYCDPEAVVGCADGTARVFDMYSSRCSQILRMHDPEVPVTCLGLSDEGSRLSILAGGGSSITVSSVLLPDHEFAAKLHIAGDIKTLSYNPCGNDRTVFAGSSNGYVYGWDLRTRRLLWETRVSWGAVCSMQHRRNDASTLVVGGMDGVLHLVDQNTGKVVTKIVLDTSYCVLPSSKPASSSSGGCYQNMVIQRLRGKRISPDADIVSIPAPPITCLAVGMKKLITTHDRDYIRTWKFN
ncbi:F-box/WD-40 repeat-containing protein [Rosa sericea]